MILGGPKGERSVAAVEDVMGRAGFAGPCAPVLRAQGGGNLNRPLELGRRHLLAAFSEPRGLKLGNDSKR
jgi:hypothetical protein